MQRRLPLSGVVCGWRLSAVGLIIQIVQFLLVPARTLQFAPQLLTRLVHNHISLVTGVCCPGKQLLVMLLIPGVPTSHPDAQTLRQTLMTAGSLNCVQGFSASGDGCGGSVRGEQATDKE